ncbi:MULTISPECIES: HAMP domain-containing sensor histidine kinase [Clostridium]|uniref:histidine kinase n=3 Tax=Clostridium TaxID=1485 RepID=D8GLZ3_CLOLD|nr:MULTISPECIES: ATP-binding protein [Clostridium]ADK15567.1 predicted sensory transduction histidine kinase [Clostridium ljungdahlii DSM 13528]AGY74806.1 cell wall metabolism sensor histidine kinase WalK [Clostridium autoethanogenum DSM 10061]ALU34984.1 Histidine kinase containing HAMP and ATP-binding domains [Clostridium autoethanogenum DSM 10061]OAA85427.1 Sensor protein SrrB [Clostridium ljungdahlii DSM 13528]OVY51626.1 Sensor protein SrrB [Clostridium autoethanogenum]
MKISHIISENKIVTRIRKNITWKLFIITALVFIIFISSTLTFQMLFFGKFYINKKESNMLNQVEKFRTLYNKTNDEDKLANLIRRFEQNNNAKIVIMDRSGKIKFITKLEDQSYDKVRIKAINDIIVNWTMNSDLLEQVKRDNRSVTVITEKKINGTKNILTVVPNKKNMEIIFSITSLQPVNEASSVIKEFYFYFYIGAIVLILILCLMYTNMVSKPLVKLNDTAKKMAALDFSEKCNIKNEDEIGNLASTLNFLSYNLDKALTSVNAANEKLEKDIEKERNIDKARKEFIAAVSHELKTPINLIGGYAEGLKDGIFQESERDQYIDIIIDESNKMANLVSDMLNLSHLESGTMKLSKEEFFIDDLIECVIRRFYKVIKDKGITINCNIITKTKICADWDKMEQVITNFTTNAIKNTYEGGIITFAIEEESDKTIVSVENTGKGIPEEELGKIWGNFYKLDKSRNRKLGGTGIGLAIVKNILILHGYKYGVKNTDNGIKFYFVICKV